MNQLIKKLRGKEECGSILSAQEQLQSRLSHRDEISFLNCCDHKHSRGAQTHFHFLSRCFVLAESSQPSEAEHPFVFTNVSAGGALLSCQHWAVRFVPCMQCVLCQHGARCTTQGMVPFATLIHPAQGWE